MVCLKSSVASAVYVAVVCLWSSAYSVPVRYTNVLEEVYPTETNANGIPVDHQTWQIRGPNGLRFGERKYFSVNLQRRPLLLNLTKNEHFLPGAQLPVYSVQHQQDEGAEKTHVITRNGTFTSDCHYTGSVHESREEDAPSVGWATVSLCNGMNGLIKFGAEVFFIRPSDHYSESDMPWRHDVERRDTLSDSSASECTVTGSLSGIMNGIKSHVKDLHQKRQLGMSSFKVIETALVADKATLDYHGSYDNLVTYMLDIMNLVSHIFQDASTGSAIQVVLVKLIVIESNTSPFSTSDIGSTLKDSFCKWQYYDPMVQSHEHDIAVLLTRNEICEGTGTCKILGTANLGSICKNKPNNCVLVKDNGLGAAFTMAHELGHSLGLVHDDNFNAECHSGYYLMSANLAYTDNPHRWSECSKIGLRNFLESHESSCLDSMPQTTIAPLLSSVPVIGEKYSLDEQCTLLYGSGAVFCVEKADEVCSVLHCRLARDAPCITNSIPPAPGSPCTLQNGSEGVCYQGRCEHYDVLSQPVDGGWGQWGEWGQCNKYCGTGVQSRERECDSPPPAYGGQPCLGQRQEHRLCNTHPCEQEKVDPCLAEVHQIQQLFPDDPCNWTAVPIDELASWGTSTCQVFCTNPHESSIFHLSTTVEDGTHCLTEKDHWEGVCVASQCIQIGCDGHLRAEVYVDKCGVKCGNGSMCDQFVGTFVPSSPLGVKETVLTVPSGSWDIVIEEVRPSNNTLIVSSNSFNGDEYPDADYYQYAWLGGAWWYYYKNTGESKLLKTGNTLAENVTLEIVVNDLSATLKYSFSTPAVEDIPEDDSNATTIISPSVEVNEEEINERNETLVATMHPAIDIEQEEMDTTNNMVTVTDIPDINLEREGITEQNQTILITVLPDIDINEEEIIEQSETTVIVITYTWKAYNWSLCSTLCDHGEESREVKCVTEGNEIVDDEFCDPAIKPETLRTCFPESCANYLWVTDAWSECNTHCGSGSQSRSVTCLHINRTEVEDMYCAATVRKPSSEESCESTECPSWSQTWSECSAKCGGGKEETTTQCLTSDREPSSHCDPHTKPADKEQDCNTQPCCNDLYTTETCALVKQMNWCSYYKPYCCYTCS